jgi:hypothetical protein
MVNMLKPSLLRILRMHAWELNEFSSGSHDHSSIRFVGYFKTGFPAIKTLHQYDFNFATGARASRSWRSRVSPLSSAPRTWRSSDLLARNRFLSPPRRSLCGQKVGQLLAVRRDHEDEQLRWGSRTGIL